MYQAKILHISAEDEANIPTNYDEVVRLLKGCSREGYLLHYMVGYCRHHNYFMDELLRQLKEGK
jgi:hypothetical protein